AGAVARSLGMPEIVVPPAPGILCAEGLVVAELKEDFVASGRTLLDERAGARLGEALRGLAARAETWFVAERVAAAERGWRLALDMRYVGQNFELLVPVGARPG